jgi:hypothetical protein
MPILGMHPRAIHDSQHAASLPASRPKSRSHAASDNGSLL